MLNESLILRFDPLSSPERPPLPTPTHQMDLPVDQLSISQFFNRPYGGPAEQSPQRRRMSLSRNPLLDLSLSFDEDEDETVRFVFNETSGQPANIPLPQTPPREGTRPIPSPEGTVLRPGALHRRASEISLPDFLTPERASSAQTDATIQPPLTAVRIAPARLLVTPPKENDASFSVEATVVRPGPRNLQGLAIRVPAVALATPQRSPAESEGIRSPPLTVIRIVAAPPPRSVPVTPSSVLPIRKLLEPPSNLHTPDGLRLTTTQHSPFQSQQDVSSANSPASLATDEDENAGDIPGPLPAVVFTEASPMKPQIKSSRYSTASEDGGHSGQPDASFDLMRGELSFVKHHVGDTSLYPSTDIPNVFSSRGKGKRAGVSPLSQDSLSVLDEDPLELPIETLAETPKDEEPVYSPLPASRVDFASATFPREVVRPNEPQPEEVKLPESPKRERSSSVKKSEDKENAVIGRPASVLAKKSEITTKLKPIRSTDTVVKQPFGLVRQTPVPATRPPSRFASARRLAPLGATKSLDSAMMEKEVMRKPTKTLVENPPARPSMAPRPSAAKLVIPPAAASRSLRPLVSGAKLPSVGSLATKPRDSLAGSSGLTRTRSLTAASSRPSLAPRENASGVRPRPATSSTTKASSSTAPPTSAKPLARAMTLNSRPTSSAGLRLPISRPASRTALPLPSTRFG